MISRISILEIGTSYGKRRYWPYGILGFDVFLQERHDAEEGDMGGFYIDEETFEMKMQEWNECDFSNCSYKYSNNR